MVKPASYKVSRACVIEGSYFAPGDVYTSSPKMSEDALDALIENRFLEPIEIHTNEKIVIPWEVYDLIGNWYRVNDRQIEEMTISTEERSSGMHVYHIFGRFSDRSEGDARLTIFRQSPIKAFEPWDPWETYTFDQLAPDTEWL